MSNSNEIWIVLLNNAIYEVFIICGMYLIFINMLNIEKKNRRIFFICFFIGMLSTNEIIHIINHSDVTRNREIIVSSLAIANTMFYITVLKTLSKQSWLYVFLTDLIAQIVGAVVIAVPYMGMLSIFNRKLNMPLVKEAGYYNLLVVLLICFTMSISLFILQFIGKKWLSRFYNKSLKWRGVLWILVVLFNGAGYFVCIKNNIRDEESIWIPAVTMTVFFIVLLYMISWWVRRYREKQAKEENRILNIENAVMKEYYATLDYQLERTRKFRHDIEKHMSVIKEIESRQHKGSDREKYNSFLNWKEFIEEQSEKLKEDKYCNNPYVNAILSNKKRVCKKENIHIAIDVSDFYLSKVKEIDLIAVFSNLLDNAIEECKNIIQKTNIVPEIEIRCYEDKKYLYISMSNTTLKTEKIVAGYTTKEDKYAHGVGNLILQDIVEKYQGEMDVLVVAGRYKTKVKLEK